MQTIAEVFDQLNSTAFQKLPLARRKQMFEALDKPALKPLPLQPYAYAEWKIAGVNIDYHIEVDFHRPQRTLSADRQEDRCAHHRKHH